MRRLVVLATACILLGACSTRALRAPDDDPWEAAASEDGATFVGDYGRAERPSTQD